MSELETLWKKFEQLKLEVDRAKGTPLFEQKREEFLDLYETIRSLEEQEMTFSY